MELKIVKKNNNNILQLSQHYYVSLKNWTKTYEFHSTCSFLETADSI